MQTTAAICVILWQLHCPRLALLRDNVISHNKPSVIKWRPFAPRKGSLLICAKASLRTWLPSFESSQYKCCVTACGHLTALVVLPQRYPRACSSSSRVQKHGLYSATGRLPPTILLSCSPSIKDAGAGHRDTLVYFSLSTKQHFKCCAQATGKLAKIKHFRKCITRAAQ